MEAVVDTTQLVVLVIGSVAVAAGVVLLAAGFFIQNVIGDRPRSAVPRVDAWDVVDDISRHLPTIFIPGFGMLIIGLAIIFVSVVLPTPTTPGS